MTLSFTLSLNLIITVKLISEYLCSTRCRHRSILKSKPVLMPFVLRSFYMVNTCFPVVPTLSSSLNSAANIHSPKLQRYVHLSKCRVDHYARSTSEIHIISHLHFILLHHPHYTHSISPTLKPSTSSPEATNFK